MRILCFCILLSTLFSCKKKITQLSDADSIVAFAQNLEGTSSQGAFRCNSPVDYAPDVNIPNLHSEKALRVVFHIMDAEHGTYNYINEDAIDYFTKLLNDANSRLGRNEKLNLPEENDYPVLDPAYRYYLYSDPSDPSDNGFHFHKDNDLYYFINKGVNKNNYKKDVIRKYAIKKDSIINIFIMPHHPDSIASPTYPGYGSGIALGTALKMAGIYESGAGPHAFSSLLNHEIGHILGLQHSWLEYDGCEDTVEHPNCYGPSKEPPCNGAISNNMMDYNFAQIALSPCQIGKIHKNIARINSKQRKLVNPTWCVYKEDMTVRIMDSIVWPIARDVEGDIVIEKGGVLAVKCRLSLPREAQIIIEPGGKLILDGGELHNSCGENWSGIKVISKKKKSGKIVLIGKPKIRDLQGDASKA